MTSSYDCSVRAWGLDGLYLGTLCREVYRGRNPKWLVPFQADELHSAAVKETQSLLERLHDVHFVAMHSAEDVAAAVAEESKHGGGGGGAGGGSGGGRSSPAATSTGSAVLGGGGAGGTARGVATDRGRESMQHRRGSRSSSAKQLRSTSPLSAAPAALEVEDRFSVVMDTLFQLGMARRQRKAAGGDDGSSVASMRTTSVAGSVDRRRVSKSLLSDSGRRLVTAKLSAKPAATLISQKTVDVADKLQRMLSGDV
jgi:hypothetical protein